LPTGRSHHWLSAVLVTSAETRASQPPIRSRLYASRPWESQCGCPQIALPAGNASHSGSIRRAGVGRAHPDRRPGRPVRDPSSEESGAPAVGCGIVGAEHQEDGDVHVDPARLRLRGTGSTGSVLGRSARLPAPAPTGWLRYMGVVPAGAGRTRGTMGRRLGDRRPRGQGTADLLPAGPRGQDRQEQDAHGPQRVGRGRASIRRAEAAG